MKTTTCALLLTTLLIFTLLLPATAPAAVLGIVEVRGINNLADTASEFAEAIQLPFDQDSISEALFGFLQAPEGKGLEPNGTFRLLWLNTNGEENEMAILLPVPDDGSDFIAQLIEAGWTVQSDPDETPLRLDAPPGAFRTIGTELYFIQRDHLLILANQRGTVQLAAEEADDLPGILPVEGVVAAQLYPAKILEILGESLVENMEKTIDAMQSDRDRAKALPQLYARGYIAVARQLESFAQGLTVANNNLALHTHAVPVADSLLARWCATLESPSATSAVANLPGALISVAMHQGDIQLLTSAYLRYYEAVMTIIAEEAMAEAGAEYIEILRETQALGISEAAMALLPPTRKTPVNLVQVNTCQDTAAMRQLNTRSMELATKTVPSDLLKADVPFEVTIQQDTPREYRDIPIDRATCRLTFTEAADWIGGAGFFLDIPIEQAWLPKAAISTIGGGAAVTEQLIDRALDGTATPISDIAAWAAAYPRPESDRISMGYFAMFETLRAYTALFDSVADTNHAEAIPDSPGNLATFSYRSQNGLSARLRFPLADIASLVRSANESAERKRKAYLAEQQEFMRQLEEEGFDFQMLDDDDDDEDWDDDDDDSDDDADEDDPDASPWVTELDE